MALLRSAPLGGNLSMGRFPELDEIRVAAEHDGVVPAPHHHGGGARSLGDGYQMTRQYPLSPRRRELRCVPDGDSLAVGQDLAGILLGAQHDAAVKPWGSQGTRRPSSHPSSMRWRVHGSPVFPGSGTMRTDVGCMPTRPRYGGVEDRSASSDRWCPARQSAAWAAPALIPVLPRRDAHRPGARDWLAAAIGLSGRGSSALCASLCRLRSWADRARTGWSGAACTRPGAACSAR